MIVVDSSVWADYFSSGGGPHAERLDQALGAEEDLAILPIIVTEVLQGFRTQRGFLEARRLLISLPVIHPSLECHLRAADLFRNLRRLGVTIRGAVDGLIAQACLDTGARLLSADRDFEHIAGQTKLDLWRAPQG